MTARTHPVARALIAAALGAGALPLAPQAAGAQDASWTATLTVNPSPSAFLADWKRNPGLAILTILYTGRAGQTFHVEAWITSPRRGELGRVVSPPYTIAFGPTTQIITAGDVASWSTVNSNRKYLNVAERTGMLPEGPLQVCARVLNDADKQLAQSCADATIALPDPPQLVFPADKAAVAAAQPVFQWTPVIVPPEVGVTYHLRIVQRLPQQTPATALAANVPVFDQTVGSAPLLTYPLDALPLETGKQYVWQVVALDQNDEPITRGQGQSEIRSFTMGGPGRLPGIVAGAVPDSLTLIPGVARLRGLARATVTQNPFAYVLDGRAELDVSAPFTASIPVVLNGLEIDKTSLSPPVVRGGGLTARLADGTIPTTVGGPSLHFTRLSYDSRSGLTLNGALELPGRGRMVQLQGSVQVTAAGVAGRLSADAARGRALLTLGTDPAEYRLRHVEVTLPGGDVSATGAVDLFGQDIGCTGVPATLPAGGGLSVAVQCGPKKPVALVPGTTRLQLALQSLGGNFTLNGAGTSTYRLSAAANLSLDAGGDPCGGSLTLTVADGSVSPGPFTASCEPSRMSADLGWLALALSNVRLQRLSYRSGQGFDFALAVDLAPWLPAVPDLQLPTAVNVTVDTTGITIPASDVTVTRGPVNVAGFGVRVRKVSLPGFTLTWRDWQAHRAAGFAFGLEGSASYSGLPGGSPACLAGARLRLSNATVSKGSISATIADHRFTPACEVPLPANAAFTVNRLGGTLRVALAPALALAATPSVDGTLRLPDYFQCSAAGDRTVPLGGSATARVMLGPDGTLTGHLEGLSPACPIDLAAVELHLTRAALDLGSTSEGAQTATLSGGATATFTLAGSSSPVNASGSVAVDLMQGRLTSGSLKFQGPFQLDLPQRTAFLKFRVRSATLDSSGIHMDGRSALLLPGRQTIDATFDQVTINPQTVAITKGRILFDTPFALEMGVDTTGALTWGARAAGSALDVTSGVRIDLPTQLALDARGLSDNGTAQAHVVYGGRDLDSVTATYSPDFALSLDPTGVSSGSVHFAWQGADVGYVDKDGFHPDVASLATQLLPDSLPLPAMNVAYVRLRDAAGNLLVGDSTNASSGLHIYTLPGKSAAFVVPALALGRPAPPEVDVSFDVTVNPTTHAVIAGTIAARVPASSAGAFDLGSAGLPFAVDSVAYRPDGTGSGAVALYGALTLFGTREGREVALSIDGTGALSGSVDVTAAPAITLPLVSGFDDLAFSISKLSGTLDTNLLRGPPAYELQAAADLLVGPADSAHYTAGATMDVRNTGVAVSDLTLPNSGGGPPYLDLGVLRLGLSNLRVPSLSYDATSGAWSFDLTFDAALQFPQLDSLTLPTVQGIELTRSGFRIPQINLSDLTVDPVTVAGFQVKPVAFRTAAPVTYDWFTGRGPSDWGFGFDLDLRFGSDAPTPLRNLDLSVLDAGMTDGVFTGTIEPPVLPQPLSLPWATVDSLGGALRAAQRTVNGVQRQVQDLLVNAKGHYHYPALLRCASAPADTMANILVGIDAAGRLSGTIDNVAPSCPVQLGALGVQITSSSLTFDVSQQQQRAVLAGAAQVKLPSPTPGQTVTATGQLGIDLIAGRVSSGSLSVTQPFRWSLPDAAQPFLTFDVSRGTIDSNGLTLSGSGALMFDATDSVVASLNDLVLGLPDFSVKAGSATVQSGFALAADIDRDRLQWHARKRDDQPPASSGLLVTTPDTVRLDSDGLYLGGTATAALAFAGKAYTAQQLSVRFASGFSVGTSPVAVKAGRAAFAVGTDTIAYVTPTGFEPGNVFGVLPIPDSIALPDFGVAYLRLRGADSTLHVSTSTQSDGNYQLATDQTGVALVLPALAASGAAAPTVQVQFSIEVNPSTFAPVSGTISARASAGSSLLPLQGLGLPLDVTRIAYETPQQGGQYALHLDARLHLPPGLGGTDVTFTDLTLGPNGLSGTASAGTYAESYDKNLPVIAADSVSSDAIVQFTGACLTLGASGGTAGGSGSSTGQSSCGSSGAANEAKLSGQVVTSVFSDQSGTQAPIFFTGTLSTANGLALTIDPSRLPDPALPLGVATFTPTRIDAKADPSSNDFALSLDGVLAFPQVTNDFKVTLTGLTVGTNGVKFPAVATSGSVQQQFSLFGATFALQDENALGADCKAIGASYAQQNARPVVTLSLSGEITAFGNTSAFCGLSVSSAGAFAIQQASLLSSPVTVVPEVLTLDSLSIRTPQNDPTNPTLEADFGVTLPAPLARTGSDGKAEPSPVTVSVAKDGTVAGGTTIPVITPGTVPGITVGDFTADLREVDLALDISNDPNTFKQNSKVEVIAAICSSDGGVIAIGNFGSGDDYRDCTQSGGSSGGSSGSTPAAANYGLTVHLNGSVDPSNIGVPVGHAFAVDLKAVKLAVSKAGVADASSGGSAPSTSGFAIAIDGQIGLDASVVSGGLDFNHVVVKSTGDLCLTCASIQGGSLTVANVVSFNVGGVAFGTSDTTIWVPNGGSASDAGKAPDSTKVTASSFVHLDNVSASIGPSGGLFSGGVDDVLSYVDASNGGYYLRVTNLHATIAAVFDMHADLKYEDNPNGDWDLLIGGSGQLLGAPGSPSLAVLGEMGEDAGTLRAGLFVAGTGLTITPFPPIPLTITGIGGGFFYHPTSDVLSTVQSLVGMDNAATQSVAGLVPTGSDSKAGFEAMLYGAMAFVNEDLIGGSVLITISDNFLEFDGKVQVVQSLSQLSAGALVAEGDASLRIGLAGTPYVAGAIALNVNVAGLITGGTMDANGQETPIELWAFGPTDSPTWGVQGSISAKVVGLLKMNASLFIGPPGFYADGDIDGTYYYPAPTAPIVTINGNLHGTFWYYTQSSDWGGYAKLYVDASVLGGLAEAKGWIYGALINQSAGGIYGAATGQGSTWTLYAGGGLSVQCPAGSWSGSVWAEVRNGSVDAGFGDDPAMDQAIANARQEAQNLAAQIQGFSDALTNLLASSTAPGMSRDSLAAAYNALVAKLQAPFDKNPQWAGIQAAARALLVGGEYAAYEESHLSNSDQAYFLRYLSLVNPPSDTTGVVALAAAIQTRLTSITQAQQTVQQALNQTQVQVTQLAATPVPAVPAASPVTAVPGPAPVTLDAQGRPTGGGSAAGTGTPSTRPSFTVDVQRATTSRNTAVASATAAAAYVSAVQQRVRQLETGLAKVAQVTRSAGSGSALALLAQYDTIATMTEHELSLEADVVGGLYQWASDNHAWLVGQHDYIDSLFTRQARQLVSTSPTTLNTLAKERASQIDVLTQDGGATLAAYKQTTDPLTYQGSPQVFVTQAVDLGMELYYSLVEAGLSAMQPAVLSRYDALSQSAPGVLAKIQGPYQTASIQYDALAQSQADLEGRLYDIYDHYLAWKKGQPVSDSTSGLNVIGQRVTAPNTLSAGGGGQVGTGASGAGPSSSGSPAGSGGAPAGGGGLNGLSGGVQRSGASSGGVALQGSSLSGGAGFSNVLKGLAAVPNFNEPDAIQGRMDELAQDLEVPRLGSVQMTLGPTSPFTAQVTFTWGGTHPSGIYEYLYRDVDGANQALGTALFSNALSPTRTTYLFAPTPQGQSTDARTFQVGVRGGAGYVGVGRANYQVSFNAPRQGSGGGPVQAGSTSTASGGGVATDNTPPTTPIIMFPSRPVRNGRIWSNDATTMEATWLAEDNESGIAKYEYAVDSTSWTGRSAQLTWTNAGGRTDVVLGQMPLSPSHPVYLHVRATNGQGLTSAVAVSAPIYSDDTPPVWRAGAAVTLPSSSGSYAPPNGGPQTAAVAACPVSAPPYPVAASSQAGGVAAAEAASGGFSGQQWNGNVQEANLSGGGAGNGSTDQASSAPAAAPPTMQFERPDARDGQSGIHEYYWHVDRQPAASFTPDGWYAIEGGRTFTVDDTMLDYQHRFYVSVVAENYAGAFTPAISYGPFTVDDPTTPDESKMAFCAEAGGPPSTLAVHLNGVASDPESGIAGYQYRVRRLMGVVRDWPTNGTPDWTGQGSAGTVLTTQPLMLSDGQKYYVDVRAVNGQGQTGAVTPSGPVAYDGSPPPTPSATVDATSGKTIGVTINAPADPQSGLMLAQLAVGTRTTNDDILPWQAVKASLQSGQATVTYQPATQLAPGTYYLRLRTINGAGLPSAIATVQFVVASVTRESTKAVKKSTAARARIGGGQP